MNKPITWMRSLNYRNRYNEAYTDFAPSTPLVGYEPVQLLGLINYNYARSWPVDNRREYGKIDDQSVQVFFSVPDLKIVNASADSGVFRYDNADYFVFDECEWVYAGDTPAAPVKEEQNLVFTLILTKKVKLQQI